MLKIKEFFSILDDVAPLSLSHKMVEKGAYDNSGIIVNVTGEVNAVLFSLDLSVKVVNKAIKQGCDTIVTHHPAIYSPIKSLDLDGETAGLVLAVKNGINVISMHLNLDIASCGIDQSLAESLDARNVKILDLVDEEHGYGREFKCYHTVEELKELLEKKLSTDKILIYGSGKVKKVASFCGAGGGEVLSALKNKLTDADLIVTSDAPHHVIKEILENGKKLMLIPHYSAENYGFERFFNTVKNALDGIKAYYFVDKRFM